MCTVGGGQRERAVLQGLIMCWFSKRMLCCHFGLFLSGDEATVFLDIIFFLNFFCVTFSFLNISKLLLTSGKLPLFYFLVMSIIFFLLFKFQWSKELFY